MHPRTHATVFLAIFDVQGRYRLHASTQIRALHPCISCNLCLVLYGNLSIFLGLEVSRGQRQDTQGAGRARRGTGEVVSVYQI